MDSKERAQLKRIRLRRDVPMEELAAAMGVKPSHLKLTENKSVEAVTIDTLIKYVEALGGEVKLIFEFPDRRFAYKPIHKSHIKV